MDKENINSTKISIAVDIYDSIRDSAVAWRRKSSYKKPIKRRISKLSRIGSKLLTKQLI